MQRTFLVVILTLQLWSASVSQVRYTVVDLSALASVTAINSRGHVLGQSSSRRAVIWEDGTIIDLGDLAGFGSDGTAINDNDEVTGSSPVTLHGSGHAFLWSNGIMTDLGVLPGGEGSIGISINDSSQITGYSADSVTHDATACRWVNGVISSLGIPAIRSVTNGINNAGQITGSYNNTVFSDTADGDHAFIWQNGNLTLLGDLGYDETFPSDINNSGTVVGRSNATPEDNAFLWKDSVLTDIYPIQPTGYSQALAINDSGEVIGYALATGFHSFYYKDGKIAFFDTLLEKSSGWSVTTVHDINNRGEVIANGVHNGNPALMLLKPVPLAILRPQAAELWIAGETDTITWIARHSSSIDLLLSTDYQNGAGTFNEIVHGYPADSGKYAWHLPDSILSRKCAIQIEDTDLPDSFAVSDSFKIKPYMLTQVDGNGDYVPFQPGRDGWRFTNGDTAKLWPYAWWNQFDYSTTGIDPYTHMTYPADFPAYAYVASSRFFPDWPAFVDAFGTAACYRSTILGIYSETAALTWGSKISSYNGSCYGLAYTSLLAFDDSAAFQHLFPGIGPSPNVNSYLMSDAIRRAIDRTFTYQFGKTALDNDLLSYSLPPKTTLEQIKAMFNSESNVHRGLSFFNPAGQGAHEVTPIRIARDPATPNWMRIYLYNSNSPGSSNDYIIVDTVANQWKESTGFGWGWGTKGMYLDIPTSTLMLPAILKTASSPSGVPRSKQALPPFSISVPVNQNIHIYTPGGDSIGAVHGAAFSSMTNGIPIVPKTGFLNPPIGYYLAAGQYTAVADSFSDTSTSFSVMEGGTAYEYARSGVLPNQRDLVGLGDGLSLQNNDGTSKSVTLIASVIADSADEIYTIGGCVLAGTDSVSIAALNGSDLKIVNGVSPKAYTLSIRKESSSGEDKFLHSGITLQANSSHHIVPQWSSLAESVKVYIDLGNDGTIDDSLLLDNEITSVLDRGRGEIPKEFALYQNYPNPFNPVATISYDLPARSRVVLRVFNLLGQEVATLTNAIVDAGRRSVEWNASGFASGVYLYRLEATSITEPVKSFTEVRKMVLVK